jgi:hypothetical protein
MLRFGTNARAPYSSGLPERTKAVAAKTAGKQRGKPFEPGQSGNPRGRPEGSWHATTLAVEKLLEGEAEEIGRG